MPGKRRLTAVVLGAGLIGIDLAERIQRSHLLDCALVAGRASSAVGLRRAADLGLATSADGIDALTDRAFDVVFDATDATTGHQDRLAATRALVVDLTPSGAGRAVVPSINADDILTARHVNLVSCGAQAALPLLHALARHMAPSYVEVVTTAASAGVGRATRLNLDEYIGATEDAVRTVTGPAAAKVLVNISPASPPPPFRVTVRSLAAAASPEAVHTAVAQAERAVRAFAPGYRVATCATAEGRTDIAVEVSATGGRLPAWAGNLHIINAAAVLLAERYAATRDGGAWA